MRRSGVLAVAVLVAASAAASGSARARVILHGTVNADGTVVLRDGVGHVFTEGTPGMFFITVTDKSSRDDFHLTGPGVDVVMSGTQFVGGKAVGLRLQAGTFHYRSDARPHSTPRTFVLKKQVI